jgi:hypothetical protein
MEMTEASNGGGTVEQGKQAAQAQASKLSERAGSMAQEQVDQRSTQAGEQVTTVANDVRSVGERLREDGKDGPAKIADQVADRAEKAGSYLTDSDAQTILHDIEEFGRRQPWLALAGGIALGVASARLLKASSAQRYSSRSQATAPAPQPTQDLGAGAQSQPATPPITTPTTSVGVA